MLKPARLNSIDMLRGFVIALMALDHVRDYFGQAPFNAEDLAATTPAWFWTRWITHLCATCFVLLAGSSAFLRGQVQGTPALSRYLATRGALLVLLEMTWVSFSWQFGFNVAILQVIWAIGMGMLLLSLLVWLPQPAIAAIAAALILPHNLLDGFKPDGILWQAWHQGGFTPLPGGHGIFIKYPLMPWLGWIAAGYALGPVFRWEAARRQRFLLAASALMMLAFVALRAGNLYGDPTPWSPQGHGAMFDLMSFMRVEKYPPSLLYLLVTGSIGLALLVLFERVRTIGWMALFGRTPMFFYMVHVALVHLLGVIYMQLRFGGQVEYSNGAVHLPNGYTPSLTVVYSAWVSILVLMYGLTILWCRYRTKQKT
ncbi:MAG: heparan-alpha-glucosaminide N-acetyltransferase domain-containing protein [Pseudomonadota bacterium]